MWDRNRSFLPHECSAEQTVDSRAGIASICSGLCWEQIFRFYSEHVSLATELALDVGRCSFSALQSVSYITVGESFSLLVSQQNAEGAVA